MKSSLQQMIQRNFHAKVHSFLNKYIPADNLVLEVRSKFVELYSHSRAHWRILSPSTHLADGLLPNSHRVAVVLNLSLDEECDIQGVLEAWSHLLKREDRLHVVTYNRMWMPAIVLAESLGLRAKPRTQNYLPWDQLENLLKLTGFEIVRRSEALLFPIGPTWLVDWLNRWLSPLPLIRHLASVRISTARKVDFPQLRSRSASIVVPARNESGNIRNLLERIPRFREDLEVILVEGNSTDDTWDEILRCMADHDLTQGLKVTALQQRGIGKGDAVREGMSKARMDVVGILDADLSVPPEELPRFFDAIDRGILDFANGSRLVYPRQRHAMRILNLAGNKMFATFFSFLIGQHVRDTLCGTKVLSRENYELIGSGRAYFGNLDPFGDFDLLLGAARMSLEIRDVPIHYQARTYGTTNISRFSHGWLLCRMSILAAAKIKFL